MHSKTITTTTKRGLEVLEIMERLINHVDNYTVPAYGDKGEDFATTMSEQQIYDQIAKYERRRGRYVRPDQEHTDPLKVIHYYIILLGKKEGR